MKAKITLLMLFLAKISLAQQVWSDKRRLLPDELRHLPTAIHISHNPSPVYPEINLDTLNYSGKYVWKHNTTVSTNIGKLQVLKAGSFIWFAESGWMPNMKLTAEEFAQMFNCKNARLKKNRSFTFTNNYRFGNQIYGGDALWFVIAADKNGKLYKGIGLVETEDQLR